MQSGLRSTSFCARLLFAVPILRGPASTSQDKVDVIATDLERTILNFMAMMYPRSPHRRCRPSNFRNSSLMDMEMLVRS